MSARGDPIRFYWRADRGLALTLRVPDPLGHQKAWRRLVVRYERYDEASRTAPHIILWPSLPSYEPGQLPAFRPNLRYNSIPLCLLTRIQFNDRVNRRACAATVPTASALRDARGEKRGGKDKQRGGGSDGSPQSSAYGSNG